MNINKVDRALRFQMQSRSFGTNDQGVAVIVKHRGERFFSQALSDVKPFRLLNANAMQLQIDDVDTLSEEEDIEYIWADLPVRAWLNTSVPSLNIPPVWSQGYRGQGIKLAIIDTGIDENHPDFHGRIIAQQNFVGDHLADRNGHGTHVAGIAGGSGRASQGKYRGVAPEVSLLIAKVLDEAGNGSMSTVMAGIEWAVAQGADVMNLSLGSEVACDGSDALSVLCDAAVSQAGVVICVAAGNAGPRSQTIGSPGCARNVITIGASTDGNEVAEFSSRGPTSDGRIKPDVVFPGVGIVAPQAEGTAIGSSVAPGYVSFEGTSMATPHASGTVCLLLQSRPGLTPEQIKTILRNTAFDLRQPATAQGAGKVDVLKAFNQPIVSPPEEPEPSPSPVEPEPKGCLAALFGR